MALWLKTEWHKIIIALMGVERVLDWSFRLWEKWKPVEEFVERRTHERRHLMFDPLKYIKLIPVLEKLATDLEADVASPQSQAVASDVKELIADLKGETQPS